MNIQIFGKSKCFDTKKAERWFKERRIRFQSIDLGKYGISPGELKSVLNAVGLEALVDPKHPDAALLAYLAYDADKVEKLLDNPRLLKPQRQAGHRGLLPRGVAGLGISKRAGAQPPRHVPLLVEGRHRGQLALQLLRRPVGAENLHPVPQAEHPAQKLGTHHRRNGDGEVLLPVGHQNGVPAKAVQHHPYQAVAAAQGDLPLPAGEHTEVLLRIGCDIKTTVRPLQG